jgi:thiol:disulfide interchange protein
MHSHGQLFGGRFARQPKAKWHPSFRAVCAFSLLGLSIYLALLGLAENEAVILALLNAELTLLALAAWVSAVSLSVSQAKLAISKPKELAIP